jgi:hypothetical protein
MSEDAELRAVVGRMLAASAHRLDPTLPPAPALN